MLGRGLGYQVQWTAAVCARSDRLARVSGVYHDPAVIFEPGWSLAFVFVRSQPRTGGGDSGPARGDRQRWSMFRSLCRGLDRVVYRCR
jgi:hypothetical protein